MTARTPRSGSAGPALPLGAAALTALDHDAVPAAADADAAAVGAGRYENTSPAVSLQGPWTTSTSSQDSGGSFSTPGRRWLRRADLQHQRGQVDRQDQQRLRHRRRLHRRGQEGHRRPLLGHHQGPAGRVRDQRAARGRPRRADRPHRQQERRLCRVATSSSTRSTFPTSIPRPRPRPSPLSAEAHRCPVSWTASPEADVVGYRLYRQLGTTGARTAVDPDPVTATGYLDEGLQPGTSYRYQAAALDSGGNESDPSTWCRSPRPSPRSRRAPTRTTPPRSPCSDPGPRQLDRREHRQRRFVRDPEHHRLRRDLVQDQRHPVVGPDQLRLRARRHLPRRRQEDHRRPVLGDDEVQAGRYEIAGLSETNHTLRVVRTGTKNDSSSGRNIIVDAFVAPDVHAPPRRPGSRSPWTAPPGRSPGRPTPRRTWPAIGSTAGRGPPTRPPRSRPPTPTSARSPTPA